MSKTRNATCVILIASALNLSGCVGDMNRSVADQEEQGELDLGAMTPREDQGQEDPDARGDGGSDDAAEDMPQSEPDEPVNPNMLSQRELFVCRDPGAPRSSPARLRRLIDAE